MPHWNLPLMDCRRFVFLGQLSDYKLLRNPLSVKGSDELNGFCNHFFGKELLARRVSDANRRKKSSRPQLERRRT